IVTPIRRHGALIADLRPNGKRKKKDGAIWITYERPERLPSTRAPSSSARRRRGRHPCRNSRPAWPWSVTLECGMFVTSSSDADVGPEPPHATSTAAPAVKETSKRRENVTDRMASCVQMAHHQRNVLRRDLSGKRCLPRGGARVVKMTTAYESYQHL